MNEIYQISRFINKSGSLSENEPQSRNTMLQERIVNTLGVGRLLLGIVFLSALIKILFALIDPVINVDGALYIEAAKKIASGEYRIALNLYPMPLFPALIALGHFIVNDWVLAARLFNISAMVLSIFPLYLITRDLFNLEAALLASFVFAILPMPNEWAVDVVRGPLFVFCFAWTIYFSLRVIHEKKVIHCVIIAICSWLTIFFRIEGIFLIPIFALLFLCFFMRSHSDKRKWGKVLGFWVGIQIVLAGFLIGMLAMNDIASFNRGDEIYVEIKSIFQLGFFQNYMDLYEGLKNLEIMPPFSNAKQNILAITRHYMHTIYWFGVFENLFRVIFPVFIFPLFIGFYHHWERRHILIAIITGAYLSTMYLGLIRRDFLEYRHLFGPAFLLIPWVGQGLNSLWGRIRQSSFPRVLIFLFFLIFVFTPSFKTGQVILNQDVTIRRAGQWLAKSQDFNKASLLTTDYRISLYANKDKKLFFYGNFRPSKEAYERIQRYALKNSADLIAIQMSMRNNDKPFNKFSYFRIVKSFKGEKDQVDIYQAIY